MTTSEFSAEFDVLYNNITSNQAPGLSDYEKSVFLTKAQNQLVQEYFNPMLDGSGGGFDGSPKRQIDFSSIIDWEVLYRVTQNIPKYDPRSIVFAMPKDLLLVLDEQLSLLDYSSVSYSQADNDTFYSVVPVSYEEYNKLMAKPFKYPPKNQAWRLIVKKMSIIVPDTTDIDSNDISEEVEEPTRDGPTLATVQEIRQLVEIIGKFPSTPYYRMRYVRKPVPIVLEDLSLLGVSIDSVTAVTNCELPDETHHEILERAVTLAKIAWQGTTMTQTALAVQASK